MNKLENLHSSISAAKTSLENSSRLLAVDPSLTCSGWALFCIATGRVKRVGVIKSLSPQYSLSSRLVALQQEISLLMQELSFHHDDYLICEGPAPIMLNPKTAMKVEGVRGIFETVARSRLVNVPGRVNPRTVHVELLGMRGKQLDRATVKSMARDTAMALYHDELCEILGSELNAQKASQDIIDALLIGTIAVTRVRLSLQSRFEVSESLEATRSRGRASEMNRTTRSAKGTRRSWESYVEGQGELVPPKKPRTAKS